MPRKFIKKFTPDHETIRKHKYLQIFGRFLLDPNLWHLNRRSVSGAFAAGLFWAMIPMPLQMVAAAATAIPFRVNLPISVALVWLTNPLTMPPIFYFNYVVGGWLLNTPASSEKFEPTMEWLIQSMEEIWQPLYFGSFVMGVIMAVVGYISIRLAWRLHIVSRYKNRKAGATQQNN